MMKMMIKILHTADLHLGVETYGVTGKDGINSRITDYLTTLDDLVSEAAKHNVDVFIIAGDVFENERPSNYVVSEFAKRVRKLLDLGITVIITPGNHETSSSVRIPSPIEVFKALRPQKNDEPDVVCEVLGRQPISPGDKESLGDITLVPTKSGKLQVLAMPYPRRSEILSSDEMKNQTKTQNKVLAGSKYLERIEQLTSKAIPGLPTIFIGHFGIKEAELQPGKKGYLADDVVITIFDLTCSISDSKAHFSYVALGHYHNPQMPQFGLTQPVIEEDMDGLKDELSGNNPCRDWDKTYKELIPVDIDSLHSCKKPVKSIPCVYSGAPCRRDFQDGSRPRKYVIVEISEDGSAGSFHEIRSARQLRELTIKNVDLWEKELEEKLQNSSFWGPAFKAFMDGLPIDEVLKALSTPAPIFRIRMPEEGRPHWPVIRAYLEKTGLFERIAAPYCPPTKNKQVKSSIGVAESPLDAVASYLSYQKDDYSIKNIDKIREQAEKIMQDAGAL